MQEYKKFIRDLIPWDKPIEIVGGVIGSALLLTPAVWYAYNYLPNKWYVWLGLGVATLFGYGAGQTIAALLDEARGHKNE